jgi:23S rRNA pseudouridine1911/1915/1917 synthase
MTFPQPGELITPLELTSDETGSISQREVTLTIGAGEKRLDKYLANALPEVSRSQLQRLIRDGKVILDGQTARASATVAPGMVVSVYLALQSVETKAPNPEAINLSIVFEDDQVLVVNKPAGLVVHPAAGHAQGTLVNAILAHCPELTAGERDRPGIVHRLDRDTSGLVVVAKTDAAFTSLRQQFKNREIEKTYLALVHGQAPAPAGVVDVPLARDPNNRKRMGVVAGGRAARTGFRVVETLGDYSLLEVSLETGRTHQIRVHLSWLGVPVVGDTVYGHHRRDLGIQRQFLHAWKLVFSHPSDGRPISLEAPLPSDLSEVLAKLGSRFPHLQ